MGRMPRASVSPLGQHPGWEPLMTPSVPAGLLSWVLGRTRISQGCRKVLGWERGSGVGASSKEPVGNANCLGRGPTST